MPNFSKSVPDLGQTRQIKFINSFLILKEKNNINICSESILKNISRYDMVFLECMFVKEGVHMKNTRKRLHELIDKMDDLQINKLYQLVRGILGKVF